ncbi:FAD-dependent oxidoreductase [Edaphobacter modestus]|uniref:Berberine-like enzyme n=1 Tax=Edaphobacter modestus TaxID=388466 RepID=A0A4Q7YPD7_9BACT|nr:FAD-binding protein [Edaphobacter modestus]RZU39632.1 berberine-like enzyme [Edaphobacter modestus]
MSTNVSRQDPRFPTLRKSHNLRWPASEADSVGRIEICENPDDVAEALQKTVRAGLRPTIRSGGHCYEDFVCNNPGGVLLDVSLVNGMDATGSGHTYKIGPGTRLGDAYTRLYKESGVTLPGGSCYGVGAGGHISGGGYGVLSRLHGLTVDWLSAVDILTVDASGTVVPRRVDKKKDPDLFRACRGAGGNNFGVITAYYFDKLPQAPKEVVNVGMSFPWEDMTPERFEAILTTYGHYYETRGKDPDTWGMFTALGLSHRNSGRIGISVQFCNPDGTCDDLTVLNEFIDLFQPCKPVAAEPQTMDSRHSANAGNARILTRPDGTPLPCSGPHNMNRISWYDATVHGDVGGNTRAKYKSSYMKRTFTSAEARTIYKHLNREIPGVELSGILAVDSYGGAVNRPELAGETSIPQRASVMKLQFQTYWRNPADDAGRLQWMRDFYTDLYSGPDVDQPHKGTPYHNQQYEGCYINYPDADMLSYPFWPQLYYGDQGLYPFLQGVKRKYDPNNIFHHSMSVRA